MYCYREKRPRKTKSENETQMAPGPHQALDRHPAGALVEKIAHGFEIRNRLHDVRQQFYFKSLLGNEASRVHVVRRAVFEHLIATVGCYCLARGHDGLAE